MTSHRCIDGSWQDGKVKHCLTCKATLKPRPVKRSGES